MKKGDIEKTLKDLGYTGYVSDSDERLSFVVDHLVSLKERNQKLEKMLKERGIILPDMLPSEARKLKKALKESVRRVGFDFHTDSRVHCVLCREGVETIRDLVLKTEEELMGYRNFGRRSVERVKVFLKELSGEVGIKLTLGMDLDFLR